MRSPGSLAPLLSLPPGEGFILRWVLSTRVVSLVSSSWRFSSCSLKNNRRHLSGLPWATCASEAEALAQADENTLAQVGSHALPQTPWARSASLATRGRHGRAGSKGRWSFECGEEEDESLGRQIQQGLIILGGSDPWDGVSGLLSQTCWAVIM